MKKSIFIAFILIYSNLAIGQKNSANIKMADSLFEKALNYREAGMYDNAVEVLLIANDFSDSLGLDLHKCRIYHALSNISMLKKDYDKALDYAFSSLKVSEKIQDFDMIGWSYAKIGDVFLETKKLNEAEVNYKNSIESFEKANDKESKGQIINNLGLLYQEQKRYSEAEKAFLEAYTISKEIKYFTFQVYIENELGDLYRITKQYDKAQKYFDLALKGEKEANYSVLSKSLFYNIHEFYKEIGDCKKSLFYFEKYSQLTDSLNQVNQDQRVLEVETKFRTKEKEKEIVFLNKESELQQAQLKKRNIIILLSCVVILVIGGLVVVIQKSRKKQVKNNKELESKNREIEHQKQEILDSINYAKRIQEASLGNPEKIKEIYKNSAILFQPKDILSGDFYWFNKIENKFMFSVADCTGHGVPGAMMSMIGNNGLNDAVNNNRLKSPSEILNHLSDYVSKNFTKTDMDVKDGMDIAFCSLDTETGELKYAGAINSLFISDGVEVREIKASKRYIGQPGESYLEHTVQLKKGECVYIMSDGFVDQFGGENNKKFKTSNFKTLVKSIFDKDIDSQNEVLNTTFKHWKGHCEQTDDVCVISVKF